MKIILSQQWKQDVEIERGNWMAQLVCERIFQTQMQEVEVCLFIFLERVSLILLLGLFFNQLTVVTKGWEGGSRSTEQ